MTSKRWARLVAVGVGGALLAGAGAASSAPAATPVSVGGDATPSVITLDQAKKKTAKRTNLRIAAARSRLAYNKRTLRAKAGVIRITMTNPSNGRHNIAIRFRNGREKKGRVVPKGGVSRVQANLKKGRFTFFCSVPGHEEGGMRGTLIVR